MATSIPAVQQQHIRHALLIDLDLDGTMYYISSAYKPISYGGNTYTNLGALLQISSIAEDIKTTNGDVNITLSGIPETNITAVLQSKIKGGEVTVYRVFFNADYTVLSTHQRFKGIITNWNVSENVDILEGINTASVTISCASINSILENKIAGQRTNPADREKFYPGDETFYRVPDLIGVAFDFGRDYAPGRGSGGGGYGGGGGGRGYPGISFDLR